MQIMVKSQVHEFLKVEQKLCLKKEKKQSILEKHERIIFRHSKTYQPAQKLVQFLGETGASKRLDDVERMHIDLFTRFLHLNSSRTSQFVLSFSLVKMSDSEEYLRFRNQKVLY